ncbi:MAG: carboxypeptidase regulatory-like domain-containing protein [Acidobacterium ailaaui]|nr:carboxypeptidase regulatory-like domain-containing protein [Pseudacidobacterium ailaaui]
MRFIKFLFGVLAAAMFVSVAAAQEFRATLTGRVSDPSGAVVPDAVITITNTATAAATVVRSGTSGDYYVPFLAPGPYNLTVVASGFEKYERVGLQLDTGAKVTVNVALTVGSTSQTVTVAAQSPLLDTASADAGQVLTTKEIEDLPSNGRSALGFARDEYAVVPKLKHATSQVRPFDNSGASDFSLGGGNSQSNEIELNGTPNMEDSGRVSAFSPMLDAVDQVRVDVFSSDASLGDTSGGTVDITTKGGTNQFHGSLLEFYETSALAAQPFFSTTAQSTHQNQFGAAVGGPVWIPKVFNGRNRLFFFYAYEGFSTKAPGTTIASVPTDAERSGDFSALLGVNSSYQLYNPYNATMSGGNVSRQPIPGNVFANAGLTINPVAQAYVKYIPLPNYSGPTTKPDGENNFLANTPTIFDYRSSEGRLDYNVSQADKLTFELHRSNNNQTQTGVFPNIAEGSTSITNIWGGMLDNVYVFTPKLFLDTRLGLSRTLQQSAIPSQGLNASALGYPSYMASNSRFPAMPRISFSDGASIPSLSTQPGSIEKFVTYQLFTNLTKDWDRHTLKTGMDFRLNKLGTQNPGYAAGTFSFTNAAGNWVMAGTNKAAAPFGDSLAEFLLGLPMSGEYDINDSFLYNNWYFAGFLQDHWKLTHELSLDLGLRLEHETPITESHNKAVIGFDPNAVNSATAAAEAAFAAEASKYPAAPASFSPTGGLLYASSGNRSNYSTQSLYVSPRIGLAYAPDALHGKTVFRGGMGLYYNPFNDYYTPQAYGYSIANTLIASNNNMLTPAATLSDPFPASSNPLRQPFGSSQGINTYLGQSITFTNPRPKAAYSIRWSFDIQHDLGHNTMVQVGYIGNHQVHMSYTAPLDYFPVGLLSRSAYYDPVVTKTYGSAVANPFYGLIQGSGIGTGKTITLSSLFSRFPEYSSVNEQLVPAASSNMNMLVARITKRLSSGLAANINYEYSRLLAAASPLNAGGPLWYGTNASDFPQHLAVTVTYDLPFGRGKAIGRDAGHLTDAVIGGWQVAGIYMWESGTALSWGNVIYNGNWHDFHNTPHDYQHAFNTTVFDTRTKDSNGNQIQPNQYNYRTFPLYALRSDPSNNLDCSVLKNFSFTERTMLQLRVEAYNAMNHPQFNSPNVSPTSQSFGTSTSQINSPRVLQLGARFVF